MKVCWHFILLVMLIVAVKNSSGKKPVVPKDGYLMCTDDETKRAACPDGALCYVRERSPNGVRTPRCKFPPLRSTGADCNAPRKDLPLAHKGETVVNITQRYKLVSLNKNWADAAKYCRDRNAQLVGIVSKEEQDALALQLVKQSAVDPLYGSCYKTEGRGVYLWTAGHRGSQPGTFNWRYRFKNVCGADTDVQYRMIYSNWKSDEPNNSGGNQLCVNLWPKYGCKWNDDNCACEFCFVCENRRAQ